MTGNLVPLIRNLRWGPGPHERVDILQHSIRDPGGNPVVFFRHGGAGSAGDKRQIWMSAFDANSLFHYLNTTASLGRHFDLMSVGSEQARWDFPTSLAGNATLAADAAYAIDEPYTRPVYWPDSFFGLHRFVQWIKARAKGRTRVPEIGHVDLGISPVDIFGFGDSFGNQPLSMLSVTAPRLGTVSSDYNAEFGNFQFDSRVKGIINFRGAQEFRSRNNPNVQNDEWMDFSITPEYMGTSTFAEWAAIPQEVKAQMGYHWYLEQPSVAYWTPLFLLYEQVGTGNAAPTTPWTDAHDWGQYTRLVTKMTQTGVSFQSLLFPNTNWVNPGIPVSGPSQLQINQAIYNWMDEIMLETG